MITPEGLNPKEVLAHLNALGYQNITPKQLKEFIHDLKKLIKYEQKHNFVEFQECKSDSCRFDSSYSENSDKLSSDGSSQTCKSSQCSSSSYQNDLDVKSNGIDKKHTKISVIKPRNNSAFHGSSSKNISDPVTLYHHYNRYWKRNAVPGEKSHSDLRWMVRCKLLGQEPPLRP